MGNNGINWFKYSSPQTFFPLAGKLAPWFGEHLTPDWVETVKSMTSLLKEGDAVYQMMQVTGEEGVTMEDFVKWQKATLVDMVYLQQDAFDEVDASMPRERQLESFQLIKDLVSKDYHFESTEEVRDFFTRLTGLYKNLNYSTMGSPEYKRHREEIEELARSKSQFRADATATEASTKPDAATKPTAKPDSESMKGDER